MQTWRTGIDLKGTMTNSEDPGKMPLNAAFHQGLHCLLRQSLQEGKDHKSIQSSTASDTRHYLGIV